MRRLIRLTRCYRGCGAAPKALIVAVVVLLGLVASAPAGARVADVADAGAPDPALPSTADAEGGASVTTYLSPTGSDLDPCTPALPCRSLNRGYQAVADGGTVELAGGYYGCEEIVANPAKLLVVRRIGGSEFVGEILLGLIPNHFAIHPSEFVKQLFRLPPRLWSSC